MTWKEMLQHLKTRAAFQDAPGIRPTFDGNLSLIESPPENVNDDNIFDPFSWE